MTKIAGNLSHAEIAAAYPAGYAPRTKIHLQELLPGGKAGHVFRELKHWSAVEISRTIGNKGRATITLNNANDQHFAFKAARKYSNPKNEPAYRTYLRDLHTRCLPYVKEINPARRRGNTLNFQGLRTFDEATLLDYIGFLYNFDGFDGGQPQAGGTSDFVSQGLMQRVIVDSQGADGRWYALFTGLVSGIDDTVQAGGDPTINLVCVDYWRLFELSEIIIKTGLDPIKDNIQREFSTDLAVQLAFQSNSLANFSGQKIIQIVMDTVQRTMCWIPYSLWKEGNISGNGGTMPDGKTVGLPVSPTQPFAVEDGATKKKVAAITDDNFFNHEPFWFIDFSDSGKEPAAEYEGHNNLRRYAKPPAMGGSRVTAGATQAADQLAQLTGPATIATSAPTPGSTASAAAGGASSFEIAQAAMQTALIDGDEPMDGLPVGQLYATLLVDKYIQKGTQGQAYAQYISAILAPWQTNASLGSVIVRRVSDATFYDISITSNGDVLYQIPKYNNCPAEYAVKGGVAAAPSIPADPLVAASVVASPTASLTPAQVEAIGHDVNLSGINPVSAAPVAPPSSSLSGASVVPEITVSPSGRSPSAPSPLPSSGYVYDLSGPSGPEGEYDFSPPPEGFAQKHHGWNYVITSLGLDQWRLNSSEENIVTTVRVPAGQGLIQTSQTIETGFFTGRSRLEDTQPLVNRFGLRAIEAQKIFIDNLYGKKLSKDLLDRFALALMTQINGRSSVGTLGLSFRPDLDEGKNVFVLERQRLLYITGISHAIRFGESASTNLQLSFGHDVSREVFSPFVTVRDLLTAAEDAVTAEAKATPPTAGAQATVPSGTLSGGTSAGPLVPPASIGVPNAPPGAGLPSSQQPFFISTSNVPNLGAFRAVWEKASRSSITPATSPQVGAADDFYIDRLPSEMLAEVNAKMPSGTPPLSDDEYAIARYIASETGSVNVLEDIVVVEATINSLRSSSLGIAGRLRFHSSKGVKSGHYGTQLGRWAATSKDATLRGITAVRAVYRGQVGPAVRGVTNFFSPKNQLASFKKYGKSRSLPPIELAENWTMFKKLAWVGAVEGVSADRFLFFKVEFDEAKRRASRNAVIAYLMDNKYTRQVLT